MISLSRCKHNPIVFNLLWFYLFYDHIKIYFFWMKIDGLLTLHCLSPSLVILQIVNFPSGQNFFCSCINSYCSNLSLFPFFPTVPYHFSWDTKKGSLILFPIFIHIFWLLYLAWFFYYSLFCIWVTVFLVPSFWISFSSLLFYKFSAVSRCWLLSFSIKLKMLWFWSS